MRGLEGIYRGRLVIEYGPQLVIDIVGLPSRLIAALKRLATFANPKCFELQRLRFSTWNMPRYIFCGELYENRMLLPRGTFEACIEIAEKTGAAIDVIDARHPGHAIETEFLGELRPEQEVALLELAKYDIGCLVAPPGSGKTVIGCALIAIRKVSTLVLVHRKQLAEQWLAQLLRFLRLDRKQVGIFGWGAGKKTGIVDIVRLQTLARDREPKIIQEYDQVIIDECHHVPAVSFEAVLKNISATYMVGLTATPYRKDGHQAIIHMQCGPIRHRMTEAEGQMALSKQVIVRETTFRMPDDELLQPPIYEVWSSLIRDEERLELIAGDVADLLSSGRFPLILSERKEHLELLERHIRQRVELEGISSQGFQLSSDMGKKQRSKTLTVIKELRAQGGSPFLLSTGSLVGEGYDMPELCTLVLAMPISFKGRVIQYAGRIHRESPGKTDAVIYDYVDTSMGLTVTMFRKRLAAYRKMGYSVRLSVASALSNLVKRFQKSHDVRPMFDGGKERESDGTSVIY